MLMINMVPQTRDTSLNSLGERRNAPPASLADGTSFAAFTDEHYLKVVRDAIDLLKGGVLTKHQSTCDAFFQQMPGRRSLSDIVNGPRKYWIHHDPTGPDAGATSGMDVTLGTKALRGGKWAVLATLIHELAHTNGATDEKGDAEDSLNHCGMGAHHLGANTRKPAPAKPAARKAVAGARRRAA